MFEPGGLALYRVSRSGGSQEYIGVRHSGRSQEGSGTEVSRLPPNRGLALVRLQFILSIDDGLCHLGVTKQTTKNHNKYEKKSTKSRL